VEPWSIAEAYLDESRRHVERWREAGGPWRPYDGLVPVEAMQQAALAHPDARVRRDCLGVLDHAANDESTDVFRRALADPVPRVRLFALHGLSCERCRIGDLCVADVAAELARIVGEDTSPKVRHAAIEVAHRLVGRDERLRVAVERAAVEDPDELVRAVASAVIDGRPRDVRSRKALRGRS
jgi:HEAT repeat protein